MYRMFIPEWAGVDPDNGDALWYYNATDENGKVTREKTNDYTIAALTSNRIATDDFMPTVYGGFGTTVKAYGVDFSIQASYQLGGTIYDSGYAH